MNIFFRIIFIINNFIFFIKKIGGLAVAVPGEVAGYWEAHQKFGKLKWNELFEPSIELCEKGFRVNHFLHYGINATQNLIRAESSMAEIFINPETNQPFQVKYIYTKNSLIKHTIKFDSCL